jgi:pimeloyl-ACP methyl ester carboxylesterase
LAELEVRAGADTLWVEDSGGAGPPLLLLHPGITDSTVWDRLLPLLGGHRVVRYDRRGFGRSPVATEEFRSLDDLVAVLDHLGLDRAHLVGNSMGGEATLALAVTDPGRVASMTLLCPGIGGYPWQDPTPDELVSMEEYRTLLQAGDVPGLASLGLQEWCRSGSDDYLVSQLNATTRADLVQGRLEQPNPEQWDLLATSDVPTTVVAADLDPPYSLQASLDLAERIPRAALVRLETDHLPQYREPESVAAVVLDTLARTA